MKLKLSFAILAAALSTAALSLPANARVQTLTHGMVDVIHGRIFELALEVTHQQIQDIRLAERIPVEGGGYVLSDTMPRNYDFSKSEINLLPEALPAKVLLLKLKPGFSRTNGGPVMLVYAGDPVAANWNQIPLELTRAKNSPEFVLKQGGKPVKSFRILTNEIKGKPYGVRAVELKTN
jgi:hypothetical protein